MLILIVRAQVKPEFVEPFKEATIVNARHSAEEPGVARFEFLQQEDDPTCFSLVEVYRDADAAAKHKETAHYLTWLEKVGDMFAEPRTRNRYINVFPADSGW